jgi:hypothetical protein
MYRSKYNPCRGTEACEILDRGAEQSIILAEPRTKCNSWQMYRGTEANAIFGRCTEASVIFAEVLKQL